MFAGKAILLTSITFLKVIFGIEICLFGSASWERSTRIFYTAFKWQKQHFLS